MQLKQQAIALQKELTDIRRKLHENAETGFDLPNTKNTVKQKLTEYGYAPADCGKCGLTADIGKGEKLLLLRADMDALPMKEQIDVSFCCKNGNMHACGHDMHTAMLLGCAKLLKMNEDQLKCRVRLMFQPAEETFEGAKDMISSGVLSPKPDAAVMMHVASGIPIPAGTVMLADARVAAPAADYFTVKITGKSSHGSTPHLGIDALTVAAHILIAFEELSARELSSSDEAILTVGTMQAGTAPNIIAGQAVMEGTLRTYDENIRAMLKTRMKEIADSIACAFRAKAEVIFTTGCPTLINDQTLAKDIMQKVKALLGDDRFIKVGRGSGSEDFAYISQQVPAVMLSIAAGEPQNGHTHSQHHPMVTFDESVLPVGSAVSAHLALTFA